MKIEVDLSAKTLRLLEEVSLKELVDHLGGKVEGWTVMGGYAYTVKSSLGPTTSMSDLDPDIQRSVG